MNGDKRMMNIIIIGSGGHGAELDEYIAFNNTMPNEKIKVVGFLDDNADSYTAYQLSAPFLGGIKNHKVRGDCFYLIGIANLAYRKSIVENFMANGAQFTGFIHSTAWVSKSAKLGLGVVVGPMVNIGPNTVIGDFTLLNSRCSMGHDTKVGKFNFISPNVCFSGGTNIGNENLFGINSATIPAIKIGDRNKIAAGMVLDKNIANDSIVFFRQKERVIAIPAQSRNTELTPH